MADNPEFADTVENAAQELIGNLVSKQDWEEEEKERLQKEYMTEFGVVLREMMPMMLALYSGKKPSVDKPTEDDNEALEEAKVRHEATVVAVTKRRKEYPQYLSKLLGKTTRLKKDTAAVMKVDVPFAEPMDGVGTVDEENSYLDILNTEVNDSLLESTHNILTDMERLSGLADFAKVSRQMDPFSSILDDYSATKP